MVEQQGVAPWVPVVGEEYDIRTEPDHWRGVAKAAVTPGQHVGRLKTSWPDGTRVYSKILQLFDGFMLKVKVEHVVPEGVIDCRVWEPEDYKTERCRVFLDGREIILVWYADQRAGIVKTYDVARTGRICESIASMVVEPWEFRGREIETVHDGRILSETLRGKVEFKPFTEETSE